MTAWKPVIGDADGITILGSLLGLATLLSFAGRENLLSAAMILCLAFGRYVISWWSSSANVTGWRSLVMGRNIALVAWLLQLLLAIHMGDRIAPRALKRHQDLNDLLTATFCIFGFLLGVEPGSVLRKVTCGAVLQSLIAARHFVLAAHLSTADARRCYIVASRALHWRPGLAPSPA